MTIQRYDDAKAIPSHNGTIHAYGVFENPAFPVPFEHAWGYLPGPGALESHAHPTTEVYVILQGEGLMTVGSDTQPVQAGDFVGIPGQRGAPPGERARSAAAVGSAVVEIRKTAPEGRGYIRK